MRSLSRVVSIRSSDDDTYKDDQAGLLSPQGPIRFDLGTRWVLNVQFAARICPVLADNNALSRMANRTIEVGDKQWALLHVNSQHNAEFETKATEVDLDKGTDIPKVPRGSQYVSISYVKPILPSTIVSH